MATKKKSSGRKAAKKGASDEIRKEMRAMKRGEVKSQKQAVAIGLSKARRAGKDVPPPKKGTSSTAVRKKAMKDIAAGKKSASKRSGAKKSSTKKRTTKKAAAKKGPSKRSTKTTSRR